MHADALSRPPRPKAGPENQHDSTINKLYKAEDKKRHAEQQKYRKKGYLALVGRQEHQECLCLQLLVPGRKPQLERLGLVRREEAYTSIGCTTSCSK